MIKIYQIKEMEFSKKDSQKIKGIAIICMMIHHCFLAPARYPQGVVEFFPFTEAQVNVFAVAMKICVALFVFVSAYGITTSYKRIDEKYNLTSEQIQKATVRRYVKMMSGYMFVFLALQIFSLVMGFGRYTQCYGKGIMSVFYAFIDMLGLAQFFHTRTFLSTFWYMSLAQIIIIIIPVMLWIYKKFGSVILIGLSMLFSILFPVLTANTWEKKTFSFLSVYIVCIAVGIICADVNLFPKMKQWKPIKGSLTFSKIIKFAAYICIIPVILYFREQTRLTTILPIWEAVVTIVVIGFAYEFINNIPILGRILDFLGKHSMNIFLVHSLIRGVWYVDFIYGFKYPILIVIVLLVVSLFVSIILEGIKKLIRFNKGVMILQKALTQGRSEGKGKNEE